MYILSNKYIPGVGVEEAEKLAAAPQEAAGAALAEPPFEGAEAPDPIAEPGGSNRINCHHYLEERHN